MGDDGLGAPSGGHGDMDRYDRELREVNMAEASIRDGIAKGSTSPATEIDKKIAMLEACAQHSTAST